MVLPSTVKALKEVSVPAAAGAFQKYKLSKYTFPFPTVLNWKTRSKLALYDDNGMSILCQLPVTIGMLKAFSTVGFALIRIKIKRSSVIGLVVQMQIFHG